MARHGTVMAIGPDEDRSCKKDILRALVERTAEGPVALAAMVQGDGAAVRETYGELLGELGVSDLRTVELNGPADLEDRGRKAAFEGVRGVVLAGDDQLRMLSRFGGALDHRLREVLRQGGVVAGAAGAAGTLGASMVVGDNRGTYHVADVHLPPGLSLLREVIIDQHFAEGACMGRLLAAVAINPRTLGVAIDRNAAVLFEGETLAVLGRGCVYVVDAAQATHTNVGEQASEEPLSAHGLRLHVLAGGDTLNLKSREPSPPQ